MKNKTKLILIMGFSFLLVLFIASKYDPTETIEPEKPAKEVCYAQVSETDCSNFIEHDGGKIESDDWYGNEEILHWLLRERGLWNLRDIRIDNVNVSYLYGYIYRDCDKPCNSDECDVYKEEECKIDVTEECIHKSRISIRNSCDYEVFLEGGYCIEFRHQKETSCEPETLQDTNFTFDGEPLYYSGKIGEIMHEYCLDTGYCVIAIIHDNVIEFTSKVGDIEVDHQRLYP